MFCLCFVLSLKVFAEFTRVASKDLERDFFESLDRHTPRFLEIFKSKTGIIGRTLKDILSQVETKVNIPSHFIQVQEIVLVLPF